MIEIVTAPPYLVVQDLGRPGYRTQGVPVGGAMDPWSLSVANVLAGNAPGAAALEWALGAGSLRLHRACAFAWAGPDVDVTLDGAPLTMHTTHWAAAGSVLALDRFVGGRFAYLAFAGGIDVPAVLGSRSTYLPARFGGFEGRLLRSGDHLLLASTLGWVPHSGFAMPSELRRPYDSPTYRVLPGPHDGDLFGPTSPVQLVSQAFHIERSSDRTGYRLSGPPLTAEALGVLPSEPMCAGAVQLPAGGQPIVLMADAPTVGGYPVIAVVCSVDLPRLAQRQPGAEVRFVWTSVAEARRAMRLVASTIHTLAHLARAAMRSV